MARRNSAIDHVEKRCAKHNLAVSSIDSLECSTQQRYRVFQTCSLKSLTFSQTALSNKALISYLHTLSHRQRPLRTDDWSHEKEMAKMSGYPVPSIITSGCIQTCGDKIRRDN
jgi:hypothetical protein